MSRLPFCLRPPRRRWAALRVAACFVVAVSQFAVSIPLARADGPSAPAAAPPVAKAPDKADENFKFATKDIKDGAASRTDSKPAADAVAVIPPMNPLDMYRKGGFLMYPITFMSLVVVAFTIERALGLRRSRVFPRSLVGSFGKMTESSGGFDPRKAYRLCQQMPSTAANVIRSVLLKVGRPQDEVDRAAQEALARETWRLSYNVRPLNLAVTVTPLMGLLGTVLGMIYAFYATAHTPVGQDRALVLADGIYLKLITTFAGLVVAVPALFVAHYFEGRIQALMHEIDEFVQGLLPQIEKYEGKLRVSRPHVAGVEPPPVARHVDAQLEAS